MLLPLLVLLHRSIPFATRWHSSAARDAHQRERMEERETETETRKRENQEGIVETTPCHPQ
jgi:hypothetical protein